MGILHDEESKLQNLLRDAEDSDNPQASSTPDSIRESALRELGKRGYTNQELQQIRLGTYEKNRNY